MAEYIDKEKVVDSLLEYKELPNLFGNHDKLTIRGCIDRVVNHVPTVDVIEREKIKDMMYDIYMAGVNMTGEYQGCWVRFKDIEAIIEKCIGE